MNTISKNDWGEWVPMFWTPFFFATLFLIHHPLTFVEDTAGAFRVSHFPGCTSKTSNRQPAFSWLSCDDRVLTLLTSASRFVRIWVTHRACNNRQKTALIKAQSLARLQDFGWVFCSHTFSDRDGAALLPMSCTDPSHTGTTCANYKELESHASRMGE
jgi:hypothetical protein